MYLKLRGRGLDGALFNTWSPRRGQLEYPAKAAPHPRMMSTETGAHVGCHTLLGADAEAIRFSGREAA